MEWTDKQKQVIETKETDLLIAAAAGSGKTAVLVEKIKRLVIEGGVPLDRFLVVTFTRAAASEMKEKIAAAIIDQSEKDPDSSQWLQKQLELLGRASISTFDSFIIDIVKNYFYVLDLDPDLRIMGQEEVAIMKSDSIDELFEELYEEKDPGVLRFLDAYSSSANDEDIRGKIIGLYDEIMSMPEGLDWLRASLDELDIDEDGFDGSRLAFELTGYIHSEAERGIRQLEKYEEMLRENGLDKLADKARADVLKVEPLRCSTFREAGEILQYLEFERMTASKEEKEQYNAVKKQLNQVRSKGKDIITGITEDFFSRPLSDFLAEHRKTKEYADVMLGMMTRYQQIYSEKKKQNGCMDFADSNHYALEILKNEDAAAEVRSRYDYIFIDEYQDSNYIQEAIIAAVKKEDNLFMVGDIKQSIYGFRMAEPDIFRERYKNYSDKKLPGEKIDLNTNFRSKKEIIDTVNDIFKDLMEDYDEDARLNLGDPYDGDTGYKSELHIIESQNENIDDELAAMKNIETEAHLCAQIIKDTLGKEIFDSKKQILRPIKKSDIVILLRNGKNRVEKIYEILTGAGIQTYISDNSGYFDTVEVSTLIDFLRLADNRKQDIPLLSVLRSGVSGFDTDDLIRIRLSRKEGSFCDAFFSYDIEDELCKKIRSFTDMLDMWAEKSAYLTAGELVSMILEESGYYAYAGSLPAGRQRQANLRTFIDKAMEYDGIGQGTCFGLLRYIEAASSKVSSQQAQITGEGEDAVRLMTIHKSKGLEFPVVIVCELGSGLKMPKIEKTGIWHKDIGFALKYVDPEKHYMRKTMIGSLINGRQKTDSLNEEIRIFYVACTRASDRLILIGSEGKKSTNSLLGMIKDNVNTDITSVIYHEKADIKQYGQSDELPSEDNMVLTDSSFEGKYHDDIVEKLSYVYPGADELLLKSKYSVSELNFKGKTEYEFAVPSFAEKGKRMDGAAFGIVMHAMMEHLDFDRIGASMKKGREETAAYIRETVMKMVDARLFTEEEGSAVKEEKILDFFESDLGRRLLSAKEVHKEKQFNILHELDDHTIIVQGIIDCYFRETSPDGSDHIILLDYKTNADTEGIEELYADQIALYKEALEKTTGLQVKESYLYLFSAGKAVRL